MKYEIKRGTGLLWLYAGIALFFLCMIIVIISQMFELGIGGILLPCVIMILFLILGISNRFGINSESLIVSEDGIIHRKKHEGETKYSWDEIKYKRERKHYVVYKYTNKIKIKYSFFRTGELLFTLDSTENATLVNFIDEKIVKLEKVEKLKDIVDGEEIIRVKIHSGAIIDLVAELFAVLLFLLFIIFVMYVDSSDVGLLIIVYLISIPFQIKYFKDEFAQLKKEVHVVADKGFYIINKDDKKFYKFNELDKVEVDYVVGREMVESKIIIYKDNKKILLLTYSCSGFYEFLDVLQERNLIK